MPTDKITVDRYVCPDCFSDEALKRFAHTRAVRNECDFCGSRSDVQIAAPWDDVVVTIRDGLQSSYTTDCPCTPLSSGPKLTTRILLEKGDRNARPIVLPAIRTAKVLEEAVRAIGVAKWYPLMGTDLPYGRLRLGWKHFCSRITEKSRFFFIAPMRGDVTLLEPERFPTTAILDELADLVIMNHSFDPENDVLCATDGIFDPTNKRNSIPGTPNAWT
ncbi:MAG: hypothetical protein LAQ69_16745 [Acidobacteriia bacterium]|nr:hypothetical protein [Terriglobia bacterium]